MLATSVQTSPKSGSVWLAEMESPAAALSVPSSGCKPVEVEEGSAVVLRKMPVFTPVSVSTSVSRSPLARFSTVASTVLTAVVLVLASGSSSVT